MGELRRSCAGSMPRLQIFYRLIVRPLRRDARRTALMVFAVAVGVAVVLAIELAGTAAAGSFHSSLETLSGNTNLEVTSAGGVPDAAIGALSSLPYRIQIHPRMEDYAVVSETGQTLPLIGLDLIGESNYESGREGAAQLAGGG